MPAKPISEAEVTAFRDAYNAAVAEGYAPMGEAVGIHRRSAVHRAAAVLNLPRNKAWVRVRRMRAPDANRIKAARDALTGKASGPPLPADAIPPRGFIVTQNAGAYDADGTLTKQWVKSRRDAGDEYVPPPGHTIKGESALVDPEGRVMAKWVKTREDAAGRGLVEALQAAFAAHKGAAVLGPPPAAVTDDLLTVYPLPDLHLGMYAWGREAGENYDLAIARERALASIRALVAQSHPSSRAVVLGLGDYFHTNDQRNATPRSGHQLDVDGRWPKVFRAGADLATDLIDTVAQRHGRVDVRFLPGNHDPDAAVCLTVALGMFYRASERIVVNEDPGLGWFLRWGRCLLGATHGHTMKADRMAMMLATDRPTDWGETLHRHFFFGHIHHETAKEVANVRVESFGTPAAKDAYAAGAGYRSNQSLSALTFHREDGEVGRHRVNIVRGRVVGRVKAGSGPL